MDDHDWEPRFYTPADRTLRQLRVQEFQRIRNDLAVQRNLPPHIDGEQCLYPPLTSREHYLILLVVVAWVLGFAAGILFDHITRAFQ